MVLNNNNMRSLGFGYIRMKVLGEETGTIGIWLQEDKGGNTVRDSLRKKNVQRCWLGERFSNSRVGKL